MLVGSVDWGKEEVHQVVTWRTNVKGKGPGRPMTLRDFTDAAKRERSAETAGLPTFRECAQIVLRISDIASPHAPFQTYQRTSNGTCLASD